MNPFLIIAHRGASKYCPENTMAAFRKALELGANAIETDVHMTEDGRLVLLHDESLKRTTGSPQLVKDVTFDELKRLDAGGWFDSAFQGERVPALEDLFELVADTEVQINLELKNGVVLYPGIEEAVVAAARQYGMADRVLISSFNHYSLALCKQLAPEIRTGILYTEGLYRPWDYAASVGANALHAFHIAVLPEWVQAAAERGLVYYPYTVNEPDRMRVLLDAGVSGIITDYPDRLAEVLAEKVGNRA
ncbi:glycerophosphoryl diester phosphodiesterase [Paenibacillus sp. J31TS4]|uniref:glycerophosphodiester phosphodiesterase n=1 Tax=Paenibacillus sp. J31TS4 TaxID=2807195 RepID=UPI001B1868C9|nr:glycerophosphodiester phosphodiesterase [Paenibacillus sp. J31TS4]GIP36916.1 glycerophosphoryl diester phosphodiesterase [Paenibacillus sp. J31TS4]